VQKVITLAHGNGGEENNELISTVFYKAFSNEILEKSEDAAVIENGKLVFCTDSFTVSPLFFSGGDIGKLSICGTCNDLAMMGAEPKYLTCSVIIEEGFDMNELEKIVDSMQKELKVNDAIIVSGDTKVVPKGSVDKIFINTSGIGEVLMPNISASTIKDGDVILVSGDIGRHGASIFISREGLELESTLQSDCQSLYPVIKNLIDNNIKIKALRDATRGGVASVLNEWAKQSKIQINIQEDQIPVSDEVQGICEMLGFEATSLANEGTFILAIDKSDQQQALEILKQYNPMASVIGNVKKEKNSKVILHSSWGTQRYLDFPNGELLPRIC
jgi:hydrogenase expression/formation protein HypE